MPLQNVTILGCSPLPPRDTPLVWHLPFETEGGVGRLDYITEKPFQSRFAGTVPIYDGGCVQDLSADAIIDASRGGRPQCDADVPRPGVWWSWAMRRATVESSPTFSMNTIFSTGISIHSGA
jgi:hypothetical protein